MSGGKVNKGVELLFDARRHEVFNRHVELYRVRHGIPPHGFANESEVEKWRRSQKKSDAPTDYSFKKAMLGPYAPPTPGMMKLLDSYLLLGSGYNKKIAPSHASSFDIEMPSEDELKQSPQSFIKLRIYSAASKPDAKKFIDDMWKSIEGMLYVLSKDEPPKRVRAVLNKDLILLVLMLARRSRATLLELSKRMEMPVSPGMRISKEELIAAILKKRGHPIKSSAVKKTMQRHKEKNPGKEVRRYT